MAIDTAGRLRGSSIVVGLIILCGSLFALSIAKDEALNLGAVIGIDLGTTYSCVGVYKNGRVEIIANDQGNRVTPSWVAFTDDDGERLIGEAAKNQSNLNAARTIFDVKRLIGREFEDEEIQRQMKRVPYKIVNNDGKPSIQVKFKNGDTKVFSPEEINAVILTKMKEIAEAFLGKKIKDAVITVPVYFNLAQRQATKDAGIIAGLNITSIINEPTAAAISYGLHENGGDKRNILIFHLGGRTFDISILNIDDYVFEVLAENSDTYLGGEDFDQRIMEYFIKLINNSYRKDISKDNVALGKLRRAAERAKRDLSSRHQVSVEIESLFDDDTDFSEPLTRACFEELNDDLFRKIVQGPVVKKSMQDAGLDKSQIDEIVLVGGSTRIPKIQQLLKEYFNGKELNKGVDPDEVVAYGAALQGGIISGELESIRTNDKKGPGVSQEEIERLFREALEKDGLEDSIYGCYNPRERIEARYILETRLYGMNRQINDKVKLADKLSSDEKDKIEAAMMKALEWLEENSQTAEKEDYEEKLKEFEDMCNPIIADVYQRSGGPSAKGSKDFDDGRD